VRNKETFTEVDFDSTPFGGGPDYLPDSVQRIERIVILLKSTYDKSGARWKRSRLDCDRSCNDHVLVISIWIKKSNIILPATEPPEVITGMTKSSLVFEIVTFTSIG